MFRINTCFSFAFTLGWHYLKKTLDNVSLPGYGSFTRHGVMGEKENSMAFTCCLCKESLAGDKNRFQTLHTPACAWNFSVLRSQVHMQTEQFKSNNEHLAQHTQMLTAHCYHIKTLEKKLLEWNSNLFVYTLAIFVWDVWMSWQITLINRTKPSKEQTHFLAWGQHYLFLHYLSL